MEIISDMPGTGTAFYIDALIRDYKAKKAYSS